MSLLHDREQAAFDTETHGIERVFQDLPSVLTRNAQDLPGHAL